MGFGESFGELLVLGSPFAFRFAGTRDGVALEAGAGGREEFRELSLDIGSALSAGGIDCRDGFRGFAATGVGVGARGGAGSALERILEKAIGSAGLLGV